MKFDTVVIGAGIVGVSIAAHLQKRGRAVALVDRKPPGFETSFGNAGLIQREAVYPYAFPRSLGTLLHYACNNSLDVRYHVDAILKLAPFLWQYWRNSHPRRHALIAKYYATLIEHCVNEHRALAKDAGVSELLRPSGWIKVFRSQEKQDAELRLAEQWHKEYGIAFEPLDNPLLRSAEPGLDASLLGGLRFTGADSVSDPNALVTEYARYFLSLGGRIFLGNADTLRNGWTIETQEGRIEASSSVIAMGAWSGQITTRLGYRLPLAVKRGYHMHYEPPSHTSLNHPVLDVENGYLIAPMARGIRLTTGIEFARPNSPKTPTQLDAAEPIARTLFPLGKRLDDEPWMGQRHCTPDMVPIIGRATHHENLWFAFGHAHHGLTLGAVTGRLVAEMITGEPLLVDPRPFRVDRFGR